MRVVAVVMDVIEVGKPGIAESGGKSAKSIRGMSRGSGDSGAICSERSDKVCEEPAWRSSLDVRYPSSTCTLRSFLT